MNFTLSNSSSPIPGLAERASRTLPWSYRSLMVESVTGGLFSLAAITSDESIYADTATIRHEVHDGADRDLAVFPPSGDPPRHQTLRPGRRSGISHRRMRGMTETYHLGYAEGDR